ncbi:MAG: hypothetical protein M8364_11820 [Methylobacter sp.]|nr:hypothetical protein [Methylobacter sp.]MCL7421581.1 hypothetical protein [Methylobacter sp.]
MAVPVHPARRIHAHELTKAVDIEIQYAFDILPEQYKGAGNPFPWMSEVLDLNKEKNFFETGVTEYQTGGALNW